MLLRNVCSGEPSCPGPDVVDGEPVQATAHVVHRVVVVGVGACGDQAGTRVELVTSAQSCAMKSLLVLP